MSTLHSVYAIRADETLIYVGCSNDVETRHAAHRRRFAKHFTAPIVCSTLATFNSRDEALDEEARQIAALKPAMNRVTGKSRLSGLRRRIDLCKQVRVNDDNENNIELIRRVTLRSFPVEANLLLTQAIEANRRLINQGSKLPQRKVAR